MRVLQAPRDPLAQGRVLRNKVDNNERNGQLRSQFTEQPTLPALQKCSIDDHLAACGRRASRQLQRSEIGFPRRLGRVKAGVDAGTITRGRGLAI